MKISPLVEVIIPTTASSERTYSLCDAIDSVLNQRHVQCRPLILLNGDCYSPELRRELEARSDLSLHYQEEGNLPKAIAFARSLISAEYYCFLDDDDLLLDDSIAERLKCFDNDSDLSVVVGNGYIEHQGKSRLIFDSSSNFRDSPLNALSENNWLASCGGLFKSKAIGFHYFQNLPKYFEWTWVAFRLALDGQKIAFTDKPTFRVRDSRGSLSKETGNIDALISLTEQMLDIVADKKVRKKLKNRLGVANHMAAQRALEEGRMKLAWHHHIKSMNTGSNIWFITYTRYLMKRFAMSSDDP